jgi:STE24 endopeptidase
MLAFHTVFLLLLVGSAAFFTWLAVRDVRHATATVTEEQDWLETTLGVEDHKELLSYHRITTAFGQLQEWVVLGGLLLVLYLGGLELTVDALAGLGLGPVATGVLFFVGLVVVSGLSSLPFSAVDTFAIQESFDFNQSTVQLWARDQLVSTAVSVVMIGLVVGVVLWFTTVLPSLWWVVGWAFVVAFLLAMQVVYPRVIAPLFNDFEPVEAGDLREGVEEVFERAGFSPEGIYVMDASRRSSQVNAYFVGFGETKRVVLFDTLVDKLDVAEAQAVLAHELAHWKRNHIWKRLGASALRLFVVFAALGYLVEADWLYAMWGLPTDAVYAGLFVATLWIYPILDLTSPIENRVSLSHEREADDFAADVMDGPDPLADALARLTQENLSNPFPDPLYAEFHYSHPPIPERIRRLQGETDDGSAATGDESPATGDG